MPPRLTDDQRRYRMINEAQFQRQVIELAQLYGWSWVHVRRGIAGRGAGSKQWVTPISGPLGSGWPDLVLVHPTRGLIFAELKRETGVLSDQQMFVLGVLGDALTASLVARVVVWRPSDIDTIAVVLSENRH
jgi:hypothetical protein